MNVIQGRKKLPQSEWASMFDFRILKNSDAQSI